MKIKRRYAGLVSGLLISLSLSLSISFVINMLNQTPWNIFLSSWIKSSAVGFSIGYPLGRMFVPIMLEIVEKRIEDD
jgi:hypothetical protein